MATDARVCPFCGEAPGPGVFCASCGRNLSGVDQLPTRAAWAAEHGAAAGGDAVATAREPSLGERRAAIAAFLEAMHAAGDPGTTSVEIAQRAFLRTPRVEAWIVRPVHRDDPTGSRGYQPGLALTVGGELRQLDNEVRGWGQRDFPVYRHTVSPEALPVPEHGPLVDELAAVLRENGIAEAALRR